MDLIMFSNFRHVLIIKGRHSTKNNYFLSIFHLLQFNYYKIEIKA
jgi:hypothetical protein